MRSRRFAPVLLVSLLVWEFCILSLKAAGKLFWYDELLTLRVSALQPFSLLWKALQAGVDGMPPGYYMMVRLGRMLPGDPHVTLRLPSILGYLLTLLGVYWFARKRLPAFAGLAAVILITLSPFREYALEARCYALLAGFLAVAAVVWQSIDERPFMAPLLALSLTLAVSCHYLAVITLAVFGIAELTWTFLSRHIRWKVWAACIFASFPFLLDLPLILSFRNIYGRNFWSRPSWGTALSTYGLYLGLDYLLALVLVAFFSIVVCSLLVRMSRRRPEEFSGNDFSPSEIILIGGFLLYPALLVVLAKLLGSAYTPRYGWPAIFGLVLGLLYLSRTLWLEASSIRLLGALLLVFAVQAGLDSKQLAKAGPAKRNELLAALAELTRSQPDLPIVFGDGGTYLAAVEYAPPALRSRFVQVIDLDNALRLTGSDTMEKENSILARYTPLRIEDLAPFQAVHQRFLLCSGGNVDWFTPYLMERKYNLRLLLQQAFHVAAEDDPRRLLSDRSVYLVERY